MAGSSLAGRPGWLVAAAPALLFLGVFLVFLRHNAYPLASPEILGCSLLLSMASGGLGALVRRVPAVAPLILAGSIVMLLDLQFDVSVPVEGIGETAALLATTVVLAALLHWLGAQSLMLVGVMAAAFFVTTLVTPAAPIFSEERSAVSSDGQGPFVLHLIFDEHIGPAGLRAAGRFDDAARLRRFLEGEGFLVFDAAYSEHHITVPSLSHALNFVSGRYEKGLVDEESSLSKNRLTRSRYFAALTRAGYAIDVYQPDHMDFCHSEVAVASCHTHASSKLGVLKDTTLTATQRGSVILGVFLMQSDLWNELRELYNGLRERFWPTLAAWHWGDQNKVATIGSTSTLARLERDLTSARRGRAVISHVLLTHSPYVYDAECVMRPPSDWRFSHEWFGPARNTPDGRTRRYIQYTAQLACAQRWIVRLLQAIPDDVRRDAVVVLHGDHGSRITISPQPPAPPLESDDIDSFSTLFAVRSPAIPAGHDARQSSISCLLREFAASDFTALGPSACQTAPVVLRRDRAHSARPLRRFDREDTDTGTGPDAHDIVGVVE